MWQVAATLFQCGVVGEVGAMSPYTQQVRLVRRRAEEAGLGRMEVDSIDRYQVSAARL